MREENKDSKVRSRWKSTMVGTLRIGKHQVHLLGFFKSMGLLPNTPCFVIRIRMLWQKEET